MKQIAFILLMIMPMIVSAQNNESDILKSFEKDFKLIAKCVSKKDAVIRFVSSNQGNSETNYKAIVMLKNFKKSKTVNIDSADLKFVWNNIMPFLNGIENIYFQSVGKIDDYPIEYIFLDDSVMICEKFKVFRITSLQEILKKNSSKPNYKTAVIFGGIEYNFGSGDMKDMIEYYNLQSEYPKHNDVFKKARGVQYLNGAEIEAKQINEILNSSNIKSELFEYVFAMEENFKKLSGQPTDIIHIATCASNIKDGEDISALLFAGANTISHSEYDYSAHLEDGFLSSDEIKEMNLSNTDLLVLSTGLTNIYKAFKVAGVNTIIRSVWSVDDNATRDLMIEFYKNLVSGKSKREALLAAQAMLRSKYKDPRMWAAFVMVDGVE